MVETSGLGAHDFCTVPPSAGDDDTHRGPDNVVHRVVQRLRLVGRGGDDGLPDFAGPDSPRDPAERQRVRAESTDDDAALGSVFGGGVELGQPVASHA